MDDLRTGDTVTFFGSSTITADNVASLAETISYEVLCGVSRRGAEGIYGETGSRWR